MRRKLLQWFDQHGRDYPWRKTNNWFHLLMAEMMLRRTRSDQVVSVYEKFTADYQSPAEAASLSENQLRSILGSLGLDWRAAQMHETIAYLKDHYASRAPHKEDELTLIPGVGDYSSAMLRNRLFNAPVAAVDSNVARTFCRLMGQNFHAESRRDKRIIRITNQFVAGKRARDLNLAIIDLSALICKPSKPHCIQCPWMEKCKYAINEHRRLPNTEGK